MLKLEHICLLTANLLWRTSICLISHFLTP